MSMKSAMHDSRKPDMRSFIESKNFFGGASLEVGTA